ncbi:MAG TPA: 50S ribosomal protein L6 [Candidatus Acidoferrum sp.]|nr:50S ribosomal protein L6 [Candidatus Acidoferrum sp.]
MIELKIPEGISVNVSGDVVSVKGSLGENKRRFNSSLLTVNVSSGKITIASTETKALAKKAGISEKSFAKELSNDMAGAAKHFEIKMQSIHAHFPLTAEVKGNVLLIKNMIGERAAREAAIVGSTKIEIKGQNIRVYGISLDNVSQTAANIRKASKIRRKDERIFQDGIYYALEE